MNDPDTKIGADTRITAVGAANSPVASERQAGQQAIVEAYWKPYFRAYDPAKGAFRAYLRACLDRFLANEHKSEWERRAS